MTFRVGVSLVEKNGSDEIFPRKKFLRYIALLKKLENGKFLVNNSWSTTKTYSDVSKKVA